MGRAKHSLLLLGRRARMDRPDVPLGAAPAGGTSDVTPTTLREQLIRDEGLRLFPYRDSVGKLTIGVGRNLDDVGISMDEATMLLDHDIARADAAVATRLPWAAGLDPVRRTVLINMAFNLGINRLLRFRLALAAMEVADWSTAAIEMLDSTWARQVGARADRLAAQIISGEW